MEYKKLIKTSLLFSIFGLSSCLFDKTEDDTVQTPQIDSKTAVRHAKEFSNGMTEQLDIMVQLEDEFTSFGETLNQDILFLEDNSEAIESHFIVLSKLATLSEEYLSTYRTYNPDTEQYVIDYDLFPSSVPIQNFNSIELWEDYEICTDSLNEAAECVTTYFGDINSIFSGNFEYDSSTRTVTVSTTVTEEFNDYTYDEFTDSESYTIENNTVWVSYEIILPNLILDSQGKISTSLNSLSSSDDYGTSVSVDNLYLSLDFDQQFNGESLVDNEQAVTSLHGFHYGVEHASIAMGDIIISGSGSIHLEGFNFEEAGLENSQTPFSRLAFDVYGEIQNSNTQKLGAGVKFELNIISENQFNGFLDLTVDYTRAYENSPYVAVQDIISFSVNMDATQLESTFSVSNELIFIIDQNRYAYNIAVEYFKGLELVILTIETEKDGITTSLILNLSSSTTPDENNLLTLGVIEVEGVSAGTVIMDLNTGEIIVNYVDGSSSEMFTQESFESLTQDI